LAPSLDDTVRVWDPSNGTLLRAWHDPAPVTGIALSSGGSQQRRRRTATESAPTRPARTLPRVSETAPVAAGSLVAGYLVARETGVRPLGGAVLLAAGAWCARAWTRRAGSRTATALTAIYVAGFAGSHPLAKRMGAWPAVLSSAAVSGAASWVLADRRHA
jgi:hypothetical protein